MWMIHKNIRIIVIIRMIRLPDMVKLLYDGE